jgi:transcriptional regulator with XRE-family HTH domain
MALAPEEVGKRIAVARTAKRWTHEQLRDAFEERTGRHYDLRTVQRWQKGRNPKTGGSWLPRLATLTELADVLEVPTSFFVDEEPPVAIADRELLEVRLGRLEKQMAEVHAAVVPQPQRSRKP